MQAGQSLFGLWFLCRTSEILLLFYSLPSSSIRAGKCKNHKGEKQQVQGLFKMLEPPAPSCDLIWLAKSLKQCQVFTGVADKSHSPLSGVGKWSWVQPIPTQRVVEDVGCCSRAHSAPGALTVPDLVRNINCKYSGCRQSLWRKGNSIWNNAGYVFI